MAALDPGELRKRESEDPKGVYDASGTAPTSPLPGVEAHKDELKDREDQGGDAADTNNGQPSARSLYGGVGSKKHQPLALRLNNLSNRRKIVVGGGIGATIAALIAAAFLSLPFELVHVKHVLTDRVAASETHTYTMGRKNLYSTQFFFDQNGQFNGDKVGGIRRLMAENRQTKTMISDLEKNGYKITFKNGKVNNLTDPDGNSLKSNSDVEKAWAIKRSGDLDNILRDVYPDKSDFWYNRATAKLYRRWGLTRTDWLRDSVKKASGVTAVENLELKFRQALRNKLFGGLKKGSIEPGSQTAPDKNDPDAAGKQAAIDINSDIVNQSKADALRQSLLDDPSAVPPANPLDAISGSTTESALKDATGAAIKNSLSLKTLNLLGADQNVCSANKALGEVVTGARVLRAAQLMAFGLSVMNIADAVQSGQGVSSDEVNAIMQYLNSTDKNGKSMFQSSGWQYWTNSNAKGLFSGYDENQRDEYSAGGGFTGTLATIREKINGHGLGGNCSIVNNPFVSWLGLGASLGIGFLSGGTVTASDTIFNLTVSFATQYAVSVATQLLTPIVAGTVVNGSEQGTAVGNALVSGMEALASVNGSNAGMRPLTTGEYKAQLAAIQQDQAKQLSKTPILARLFSPNQDNSLTNDAVMGLASFHTSSLFGSLSHLGGLFHLDRLFSQPALAAGTGDCPDDDVSNNHLAATPFCNVIMGIPDSVLNNPANSPDKIDERMSCLDNSGNLISDCTPHVDSDGNPDADYEKYLEQCTAASSTGGMDIIHNNDGDGSYSNACTNDLYNLYTLYWNEAGSENDVLTGNLAQESASYSATATTTGAGETTTTSPSGDAQQLAKQILNNKNIHFAVVNQANISDNSTAQDNIQDTASGQPAKTSRSCASGGVMAPNATTNLNTSLLQFILDLANQTSFTINELAGGCHNESNSNHYSGTAVDFGCPFNSLKADAVGTTYGISDGTGETCSNAGHYHYSIGGH